MSRNLSLMSRNLSFNVTEFVPKAYLQPFCIKAYRASKSSLEALETLEAHQLINWFNK